MATYILENILIVEDADLKRIVKIVLCTLFIAVSIWGCTNVPGIPKLTEPEKTTQTETRRQWVFNEGPNWKNFMGNGDHYVVYDNRGNEFFRAEPGDKIAEFTKIGENLLRADTSGGNSLRLTRFFEIEQGLYSPQYSNVLGFGHGKVAYLLLSDTSCFVVHDMFDSESNRYEFFRDFKKLFSSNPRPELVEFTDENQLYIEYYNSNDDLVKETLVLK